MTAAFEMTVEWPATARSLAAEQRALEGSGPLWVFAYGSLMWRPDFPFIQSIPARLYGYHRSLCIASLHYRGTPEVPGVVLGLDRGGCCVGRVFEVAADQRHAVAESLNTRELISRVYEARFLKVYGKEGQEIEAYGFIADRKHPQYLGQLPESDRVAMIAKAVGNSGSSRDYLANTLAHMDILGLSEGALHRILAAVERLTQ
jgi:cation transport protein ChaC